MYKRYKLAVYQQIVFLITSHLNSRDSPEYAMAQKACFQDYNFTRFQNAKPRFADDTFGNFVVQVFL